MHCDYVLIHQFKHVFYALIKTVLLYMQGFFCNFGKGSKGLTDWENKRGKPLNWEIFYTNYNTVIS